MAERTTRDSRAPRPPSGGVRARATTLFAALGVALGAVAGGSAGCRTTCPVVAPNQPVVPIAKPTFTSRELSEADRQRYYHLDEGIQYMPVAVMAALSRPKSEEGGGGATFGLYEERFLTKPERFGLFHLPGHDGLPVGITKSSDPQPMAGINCATCHTALLRGPGGVVIVDGAPSLFAINRLVTEMAFATLSTVLCPTEFEAFYERYSQITRQQAEDAARRPGAVERALEVKAILASSADVEDLPGLGELTHKYEGFVASRPRLDDPAVVGSVEKVAPACAQLPNPSQRPLTRQEMAIYLLRRFVWFVSQGGYAPENAGGDLGRANPWGVSKNSLADKWLGVRGKWQKKPGGPISTPYIWGFNTVEGIFWAGQTNSTVERDFAQGIALLSPFNPSCDSLETTVSIRKLHDVRAYPAQLNAPVWPESILGPIDRARAGRGRETYQAKCAGCHDRQGPAPEKCGEHAPPAPGATKPDEPHPGLHRYLFCDVGTDEEYTASLRERSPRKKGKQCTSAPEDTPGDLFDDFLGPFLGAVKDAAYRNEGLNPEKDREKYEANRFPAWWIGPQGNFLVAKPLKGVWASAPYLHNGSVANMWELLSPPARRATTFVLGSVEYDAAKLGFFSDEAHKPTFFSRVNVADPGSKAIGHDFGTDLSVEQKKDLIEYIKSM